MKALEQAVNAFWLLLGAGVCVEAKQLGVWAQSGPDSGFFPLLAVSVILLLLVFVRKPKGRLQ